MNSRSSAGRRRKRRYVLLASTDRWRLGDFDQAPARYVVDVAVDRDGLGDQRVRPDAPDIGDHTLGLIPDGEPIDELPLRRARPPPGVPPALRIKSRRFEALRQQAPHHLIREGLHATVGVVD